MAGSTLTKALILILCINILLYIGGVRVVASSTAGDFMGRFIDTSTNQSLAPGFTGLNESLTDFSQSGGIVSDTFSFIDAIRVIIDFFIFLVNIVFTPFGLFISGGLPPIVGLIVGLPLTVIMLVGLAYFIRGGN